MQENLENIIFGQSLELPTIVFYSSAPTLALSGIVLCPLRLFTPKVRDVILPCHYARNFPIFSKYYVAIFRFKYWVTRLY